MSWWALPKLKGITVEHIVAKIIVNGAECKPIDMGKGSQSHFYPGNIQFYSMGQVILGKKAPYTYSISLERMKTKKELVQS